MWCEQRVESKLFPSVRLLAGVTLKFMAHSHKSHAFSVLPKAWLTTLAASDMLVAVC